MLRIHGNRFSLGKLSRMSQLGIAGIISSCAVVLVLGLMLFPSLPQDAQAVADDDPPVAQNDTVVTPRATSVGINLASSVAFAEVTPTETGATTTATTDLTVTTANSESYSLYLYSDGDSSLKSSDSANISSIIATQGDVGLTLSSLEPNTWGYNLGTTTPDNNTTYTAVPTDNSTPIHTKDTSDTNSAHDAYTLSFGAKVDTSIPSGAYSNTLTFAVVAEPAMVTVSFNGNGSTSGSMPSIKIPVGGSQALPSNTFTKVGYDFTSWNTAANGSGTRYADGANYTVSTNPGSYSVTLYAQWELINLLDDATYMQDLTAAQCTGSSDGATATLIDRRDNNRYTVAKINGACWMTQNLRLSGGRTLTSADSNVARNWTFPSTSLAAGDSYTAARSTIGSNTSYGGYYNFCAASAGTNCQVSTATNTAYDICPKGWRLPTYREMSSITGYSPVFSPVYSGYYGDGLLFSTGSIGYWWSATANGSGYQYSLYYGYNNLATEYNDKSFGFSVRCIRSS